MSRLNSQQIQLPVVPYVLNHLSWQARGLAAWFPFGANDPFADMSLAPVISRTVVGQVQPSRSIHAWSNALDFAGDDDYVGYGVVPKFNVNASTDGFTVSCWVALRTLSDYQGFIGYGENPDGTAPFGYALRYRLDVNRFDFMIGQPPSAAVSCLGTMAPAVNRLYHIVGTYSGGTARIYVNGQLENTQSVTASTAGGQILQLGRYASNSAYNPYCLDGWLMDTRLYNRALSAAEVWGLYDPQTRYDLYWMPWLEAWFVPPTAIAHALAGRITGRSRVLVAPSIGKTLAGRISGRSRAVASPAISKLLSGYVTGRSRARAQATVAKALSGFVQGRGRARGYILEPVAPVTIPAHRLFAVAAETRIFEVSAVGCKAEIPVAYPDPDSNLWWGVDWTARLPAGVTIASSVWVLPATGLVKVDEQLATPIAKVRLTVTGDVGDYYRLVNRVTYSTGEIDDQTIVMIVRQN